MSLYAADMYAASDIEGLQAGDQAVVNGKTYTVQSLAEHEDGALELYPQEELYGYIVFEPYGDGYTARMNDCKLVSYLGEQRIMMPLANDFSLVWIGSDETAAVFDGDTFVSLVNGRLDIPAPEFSQYNTMVGFQNGLMKLIMHTDDPNSPEE